MAPHGERSSQQRRVMLNQGDSSWDAHLMPRGTLHKDGGKLSSALCNTAEQSLGRDVYKRGLKAQGPKGTTFAVGVDSQ